MSAVIKWLKNWVQPAPIGSVYHKPLNVWYGTTKEIHNELSNGEQYVEMRTDVPIEGISLVDHLEIIRKANNRICNHCGQQITKI